MDELSRAITDLNNHTLTYKFVPDQETDPVKLGLREIERLNQFLHYTVQDLSSEVSKLKSRLENKNA
jgi:hypothetical protein